MSVRLRESGGAFRRSVRLVSGALQVTAAGLVALYLTATLQLDAEQWREFWIAIGVFTVAYTVLNEALQRGIEAPVIRRLEDERLLTARAEDLPGAFAALAAVPFRMFLLAALSWNLAGIFVPLWMHLRTGDLSLYSAAVIWAAAVAGGFVSCIFVLLALKRQTEPLREAWAAELGDPRLRAALIQRLPLAAKLGVACCSVAGASVLFAVLLAYGQAVRPLELHATQIQLQHLLRVEPAVAGPADAALVRAKQELRELGVAEEFLVFDASTGRLLAGREGLLSPSEKRLLSRSAGAAGDSTGLHSDNIFAWVPLSRNPDLLLVALTPAGELTASLRGVRLAFALLLAATLGVTALSALLLAGDVSRATRRLAEHAERIARGELRSPMVLEAEDELGDLARSFEEMTQVLRATVARVGDAAEGVDAAARSIAESSATVASATTDQAQGVEQATVSMASIDRQVSGITESVQLLNGNVEEAGSSILQLGAASEELHQTASALSAQVEDVGGSIEQMIRSVRQVAENTEGLAQEAAETSDSISEMASSLRQVDAHAHETARLSHRVVELAETGRGRVQQTIAGMDAIRESTDAVASVIRGLGGRVGEIGAILDVIDDVADETNLLALNAAIIAAQAGEQGKAFSVVAEEIKDLADRVLSSTKEIAALIRAVQEESANATSSIERGMTSVRAGVALSAEAGASLEEITEAARASGDRIGEIVSAVREQARASNQVAGLMERVNLRVREIRSAVGEQERGNEIVMRSSMVVRDVAQQTRRTTEEQSRGAQRIRESMEGVRDAVDRIHGALKEQSHACRQAVSFLEQIFARTRANGEAAHRTTEASRELRQQAEDLRNDVRRFRI